MSRSRKRTNSAQHFQIATDETGCGQEIELTPLEEIPIADPWHEKEVFEEGDFERKLNPEHTPGPVLVHLFTKEKRIVEVYRLCFEDAAMEAKAEVFRDFVAHFPHLVFEAEWVREQLGRLERKPYPLRTDTDKEYRRKVLGALASGFRSAANCEQRLPAFSKSYAISGSIELRNVLQAQLIDWNSSLGNLCISFKSTASLNKVVSG